MKTERLLNAIGKIDDNLIADAESNDNGCHRSVWFRFGTMAACLALILCTVVTAKYLSSHATAGAFTLDVNPSVEYTIAKNGTVKDVSFLNSDAENALRDISLEKQSVENAVKQTVSAYVTGGIMENSNSMVLVSFDSRINSNSELKAALTSTIQNALAQTQVVETVVFHDESDDSQAKEIADELSISRGKADFILAASKRTDMTLDELAGLSLDVLMMLQDEVEIDPINPAYIGLPEAKRIALKDAGLDKEAQKVVFTKAELNSSQKEPCYLLEFYTSKNQYFYQIDAKTGDILYGREYILLENAKKIAVDDAGCLNKVTFTEETLVDGGIKTPYYRLVFADTQTRWTYRIDAVLGSILEKKNEKIGTQEFISLEEAKKIAVGDAGCLNKVTFTEETLVDGGIKTPYYRLVFADTQTRWTYRIDAVLGSVLEKNQENIGTQEFISLEEAKSIALKDAGLDDKAQKIEFTKEELNRNQGTPCYILEFNNGEYHYTYRIDAVTGNILEKNKEPILLPNPGTTFDSSGSTDSKLRRVE